MLSGCPFVRTPCFPVRAACFHPCLQCSCPTRDARSPRRRAIPFHCGLPPAQERCATSTAPARPPRPSPVWGSLVAGTAPAHLPHPPLRDSVDVRAGIELYMPTSLYLSKQQGDIVLKAHVASTYFKCFTCF
jgi:hypothetical protein